MRPGKKLNSVSTIKPPNCKNKQHITHSTKQKKMASTLQMEPEVEALGRMTEEEFGTILSAYLAAIEGLTEQVHAGIPGAQTQRQQLINAVFALCMGHTGMTHQQVVDAFAFFLGNPNGIPEDFLDNFNGIAIEDEDEDEMEDEMEEE